MFQYQPTLGLLMVTVGLATAPAYSQSYCRSSEIPILSGSSVQSEIRDRYGAASDYYKAIDFLLHTPLRPPKASLKKYFADNNAKACASGIRLGNAFGPKGSLFLVQIRYAIQNGEEQYVSTLVDSRWKHSVQPRLLSPQVIPETITALLPSLAWSEPAPVDLSQFHPIDYVANGTSPSILVQTIERLRETYDGEGLGYIPIYFPKGTIEAENISYFLVGWSAYKGTTISSEIGSGSLKSRPDFSRGVLLKIVNNSTIQWASVDDLASLSKTLKQKLGPMKKQKGARS